MTDRTGHPSAGRRAPSLRGTGFWLLASYAAATFWLLDPGWRDAMAQTFLDAWWLPVAAFVGWGLGGRILGGILGAVAGPVRDRLPGWVFLFSGWVAATFAAGAVLPLAFAETGRPDAAIEATVAGLVHFAVVGALWVLLVDLPRIVLWRMSGRPQPPFPAIATLAPLAGLGAVAWVVAQHRADALEHGLVASAAGLLAVAGAAALVLTVLIELPRVLLARRGAPSSPADLGLPTLPTRTSGPRTIGPPASVGNVALARPRSRDSHARLETPPTVVRRR